ncbi:MAG: ral secretion pathway protein [Verrucomicrobiota bacterium]|jgi:type II secretory pathway component PulF
MSLFVTPRQLARRADFYHQLHQLTSAGIGVIQALEIQQRSPPLPSFREPLTRILEQLRAGATFGQSLHAAGSWLTTFDVALLDAGDRSGRLPATFQLLADHYTARAALLRQTLSSLAYPAFLFHFAILIGPLPDLVLSGNVAVYVAKTLAWLVPLYLIVFLGIQAFRGNRNEAWRSGLERFLHGLPIAGSARRSLALARLASALEALVSAGVTIIEAWQFAAAASGSPALRRTVDSWQPRLANGATPADALDSSPEFPDLFSQMYRTGEITGTLDETLRRLSALYLDDGSRKLKALSEWLPKIAYLFVAGMVAYRVISFYAGYFNKIGEATNF